MLHRSSIPPVVALVAALSPLAAHADGTVTLPSDSYWTLETLWSIRSGSMVVCEGVGSICTVPAGQYKLIDQRNTERQEGVIVEDDGSGQPVNECSPGGGRGEGVARADPANAGRSPIYDECGNFAGFAPAPEAVGIERYTIVRTTATATSSGAFCPDVPSGEPAWFAIAGTCAASVNGVAVPVLESATTSFEPAVHVCSTDPSVSAEITAQVSCTR